MLARRQGRLGKPGLVGQRSEPEEGQPPAARGRPQTPVQAARTEGNAGIGIYSQHGRSRGLETVRGGLENVGPPAMVAQR